MTALIPGAVLWDMDGTLVDTEPMWLSAQQGLVARYGLPPLTLAQDAELVGASMDIAVRVFQGLGVPLEADRIVDELSTDVAGRIGADLEWRPGARELLSDLRANGVPTALVTNSARVIVDRVLAQLPEHAFDAVVTDDDVEHGKPDPGPFLLAAERLGVPAARCLVVEDSFNGIGGAIAAQCVPVGIPNALELPDDPDYLRHPTLVGVGWAEVVEWYGAYRAERPHPDADPAAAGDRA